MRLAGAEHAREGADGAPPSGQPQEGQPLRSGSGLGAEQHSRQGHCQGHRRPALCKSLALFSHRSAAKSFVIRHEEPHKLSLNNSSIQLALT